MTKLLWTGAFSFEFGSVLLALSQSNSNTVLLEYFALHVAGSALLALALVPFVPARYARPRKWLLAFLFAFNFFAPGAGLLCIVGGVVLAVLMPRLVVADSFAKVSAPRFTTHRNAEGTGFRGGQVRAQLGNENAPVSSRLQALTAVQHTPARMTGALLRDLLADPVDDVRLLAYGMLDGKEKAISSKIMAARASLPTLATDEERRVANQQIAEFYWELIYQNLVQGDMLRFAASEALRHARAALDGGAADGGLWFMLGRLALTIEDLPEAATALEQAGRHGFPRDRMLPYLAELLFRQGRYSDVRKLFGELRGKPGVPAMAPLRRYWGPV